MIHCWLKCKVNSCTGNKHFCYTFLHKNFTLLKQRESQVLVLRMNLKATTNRKQDCASGKKDCANKICNRLWISAPLHLQHCAIENWSKVLLWGCSPWEAHSAIHMSFLRFLQVIPNVCLWEVKQPDFLSHSLVVSVSPYSRSLSKPT